MPLDPSLESNIAVLDNGASVYASCILHEQKVFSQYLNGI